MKSVIHSKDKFETASMGIMPYVGGTVTTAVFIPTANKSFIWEVKDEVKLK